MNPQTAHIAVSDHTPSNETLRKAELMAAAKEKKIVEFKIYRKDRRGKSFTEKVTIRKSTHR